MKLVEQDKIELDQPVGSYIKNWKFPESKFSVDKVTVRKLLSHSAGMPLGKVGPEASYAPEEKMPTLKEYLSKEAVLTQEPGLSFSYSNVGFNLLELLIEEVTDRDFGEYMKEEVLIPLGMKNSSFNWNKKWKPAVPKGYDLKGNPISVYVYPDKAAGNLFATVEDIATFVTVGMIDFSKNKVLNSQSINKLYSPEVNLSGEYGLAFDSYGLGHFIENLSHDIKAVSHGGQGSGWMTHFHFLPETGDGIVILTNSQRSWPVFSYILSDWAEWSGVSVVGMEQIIQGQKILWIFIGLLLFILLCQVWRLGQAVIRGDRRLAPLSKRSKLLRLFQIGFSIILVSGLLWAISQDYLFISVIFPIASRWLGLLIFFWVVVLLVLALFPSIGDMK